MAKGAHVVVRADAGIRMGFGHLTRCLSLAVALVEFGATVTVATRALGEQVESRIAAAGARYVRVGSVDPHESANGPVWTRDEQRADAERVRDAVGTVDAVVVDHYRLDRDWERQWHGIARVIAIDDLADRPHSAQIVVDHNWYGECTTSRYDSLTAPTTMKLLGPRYALLQPEYAELRRSRKPVAWPPKSVLVNFGGSDVAGQTVLALDALSHFRELAVDVAVGASAVVSDRLRESIGVHPSARLHVAAPTLAHLFAHADLAIGAGGTSTWERLCLGLPALVTTVSDNQSGVTKAFDAQRVVRWLGHAADMTEARYVEAIAGYVAGGRLDVPDVVDGFGAKRVALAVLGPVDRVRARSVGSHDTAAFITAGNWVDLDGGPERWRALARGYDGPSFASRAAEILESRGVPVGVRIVDVDKTQTIIDPYVAPTFMVEE